MANFGQLNIWVAALFAAILFAFSCVQSPAATVVLVSQFGIGLVVQVDRASRREALSQILYGTNTSIVWEDETAAEVPISNKFVGSIEQITEKLLAGTNYAMTLEERNGMPQITHIVVLGSSAHVLRSSLAQIKSSSRLESAKAAVAQGEQVRGQAIKQIRNRIFERMSADARAVERRAAMLPPGAPPLRQQAIFEGPSNSATSQIGNIPLLQTATTLKIEP